MAVAVGLAARAPAGHAAPARARAVVASAVAPGDYAGRVGQTSYVQLVVSARDRVSQMTFFFEERGSCSDGVGDFDFYETRIPPAQISASGHVSYAHTYVRAFEYDRNGHRVAGTQRISFSGTFTGTHFTGVLHDVFQSPSLQCTSGRRGVPWVADLEGTAAAPLQTAYGTTGLYTGTFTNHRLYVRTFLPWHVILQMGLTSHETSCTHGVVNHYDQSWHLSYVQLRGDRAYEHGQEAFRSAGDVVVYRHTMMPARLSVISQDPTTYGVTGVWDETARLYQYGHLQTTCTTGRVPFQATGPRHPQPGLRP